MEWIGDILGTAVSAGSGGLFGLLGAGVGKWFQWKQVKLEMEQKAQEMAHELDLQKLQMEARQEETEQEILLANTAGSWQGLSASHANQAQPQSAWAKDIKALYRPALTTGLLLLVWILWQDLTSGALDDLISTGDKFALIRYIIYSVVFTASTASAWWFAERAMTPPGLKQ